MCNESANNAPHQPGRTMLTMAVLSNVGCLRQNNEDNYLLGRHWNRYADNISADRLSQWLPAKRWLCVGVFDGMGGGERGEMASAIASQVFLQDYKRLPVATGRETVELSARRAFCAANRGIVEENKRQPVLGTTGTVVYTNGEGFKVFHLGDSRAYLLRDSSLYRLTQDQTLAEIKIKSGAYAKDSPQARSDSHKLTQFIGADPTLENLFPLESRWMELRCKDKLLLCSDGLYGMCTDQAIFNTLKQSAEPDELVRRLVEAALKNGGNDNVTCLLLTKQAE